ncbi:MAG: hypothetical protein HYV15_04180 [Elusimicrobia bacterium]|nr:hypothetical protein [Elusimicrobiota bacterium]
MTELLLILSLTPAALPQPAGTIDDCVKTRTCASESVAKADFEICVYPKKCSGKKAEALQLVPSQPCVWPNLCAREAAAPVLAQFQPCVWPNRCSGRAA